MRLHGSERLIYRTLVQALVVITKNAIERHKLIAWKYLYYTYMALMIANYA